MNDLATPFVMTADPTVRSAIYNLLSQSFRYPAPEHFARFQSGDWLADIWGKLSLVPHFQTLAKEWASRKDEVQRALEAVRQEDLQADFAGTFDVGTPDPPCPPYEGVYLKGVERTGHLIRLSEFYKHFGLKMSQEEGKRELADHLCVELQFLHFLAFKEAQAGDEQQGELLQGYLRAQRDFLERHLVGWLPAFQARLEARCPAPVYVLLGELLTRITALDLDYLNACLREATPVDEAP